MFRKFKWFKGGFNLIAKYDDVFSGFFLLAVSVVMYIATFSFEALTTTFVGPAFMPQIISVAIGIFSILIIVNGFRKSRAEKQEEPIPDPVTEVHDDKMTPGEKDSYKPVLMTLGLMVAYVFLIPIVGFLITTILYIFLQMMILSHKTTRKIWLFALVSIVSSVLIYYVFRNVFYVMLPTGIMG